MGQSAGVGIYEDQEVRSLSATVAKFLFLKESRPAKSLICLGSGFFCENSLIRLIIP
jgi:hypothetical protein